MRFFDTEGPVNCEDHYCLPPLPRLDMNRCGAEEVHLAIFDRRPGRTWDERIWQRAQSYQRLPITIWGV